MDMTNEELVKKIKELLKAEADLGFLTVLKKKDLEKLVACIRGRLRQVGWGYNSGIYKSLGSVLAIGIHHNFFVAQAFQL
jgi:hypothetical protein